MSIRVREPAVLHVNDCGQIAATLCAEAARRGLPWQLFHPTPGPRGLGHPAATAMARAGELVRFGRIAARYDLLHVHYGLMAYYALRARRPFVLHLHGSDIRTVIGQNRLYATVIGWGMRHARAVYFSTPDLAAPARRLRPDARWLPAPVADAPRLAPPPADVPAAPRLLLCSRWDATKGADALLGAARRVRALRPDARLVSLDWGPAAPAARTAGVELVPRLPHAEFRGFLAGFDLVVGQAALGVPGVTELEALAAGVPVVMPLDLRGFYEDEAPPILAAPPGSLADAALALLGDLGRRRQLAAGGPAWVRRWHGVPTVVQQLERDYGAAVGGRDAGPEEAAACMHKQGGSRRAG